jgi:DNA-binding LacI/PurR family transcriptional regulator
MKSNSEKPTDLRGPERTRHIRVTNWMRQQIVSGHWPIGARLPSYNETRARYGVPTSTMEKVYAQLESEGLIVRRRGSGTYVSEPATRTSSSTGMIGLSGTGFNFSGYSPYWAHLLGGVREAAAAEGLQILLLDPRTSDGWEKADGVLMCDWDDPAMPRKVLPGQPLVSLMVPVQGIASACADDEGAARLATEHLLALGHRRIGFFHTFASHPIAHQRLMGYQSALQAAGIKPRAEWTANMCGTYDFGAAFTNFAYEMMKQKLGDGWQKLGCTALLCHNDEAAVGVIMALEEAGLRVPHDVSIIGFDGTEYCDLVRPRLSSVAIPLREIGVAAVKLLCTQIKNEKESDEHRVLPTCFQERETTARVSNL